MDRDTPPETKNTSPGEGRPVRKSPRIPKGAVLGLIGVALVVVAGLAFLLARGLDLSPATPLTGPEPPPSLPPIKAEQQAWLESFGWQNREEGVARIPIQRAMAIIVERGLPDLQPYTVPTPSASVGGEAETAGAQVFQAQGCGGCHRETDTDTAPTLHGIYGQQVPLESGQSVVADDEYLRQSIVDPNAQIVQGYRPIMPSYQGRVSADELEALVAYIRALGDG